MMEEGSRKNIVFVVAGSNDGGSEWYVVGGIVVGVIAVILLLILLVVLIACKPWRYFRSSTRSHLVLDPSKVDDLERPFIPYDVEASSDEVYSSARAYNLEGPGFQDDGYLRPSRIAGLIHKQRLPVSSPRFNQGVSVVVDTPNPAASICVGQTLKRTLGSCLSLDKQKVSRREDLEVDSEVVFDIEQSGDVMIKDSGDQRSCLTLEVLSGPSQGTRHSVQSTDTLRLPLTMGRVSPSDLLLKDSEVSGKHAMINWNLNKLKWELVDMGSLNGTLLNSETINHSDSGSRNWGHPIELASGDLITLGTTSIVSVQIASVSECSIPFGVGLASDPMALRRGWKKLPMEDVCYYQWPLPGHDQFGFFGICDGHGGAEAAKFASKSFYKNGLLFSDVDLYCCGRRGRRDFLGDINSMKLSDTFSVDIVVFPNPAPFKGCMPETFATVLSESLNKEKLLSHKDASHVLRETFYRTEELMNHYYEGCTATLLLIWRDGNDNLLAQCSNVGDSACIMNVDGKLVRMTEDHRVTSSSERLRIRETGEPLKDGETRLCGLNLARMLGDKFLKEQDTRFSSEPYVSQVVQIDRAGHDFAIIASDGFWDVIGVKKSVQLVYQMMERYSDAQNLAEKIADSLLNEARNLRTKDNTSIIFLDFGNSLTTPSPKEEA